MKCKYCGGEFAEKAVNQRYCSTECGMKYRAEHPDLVSFPSISFRCAECGKAVVTDGKRDQRTKFCCEACEKRYWKHPPKPSAITNYKAKVLEWYEKKDV